MLRSILEAPPLVLMALAGDRSRSPRPPIAAVLATCIALFLACSKGGGGGEGEATCEAVAEHVVTLSRTVVNELEGEEKQHAEAMIPLLPKVKKNLIAECKKAEWSKAARACILAAVDEKGVQACRKHIDESPAAGKPSE